MDSDLEIEPHCIPAPWLEVRITENRGRGVFARMDFEEDQFIEACPVITFPRPEVFRDDKTILSSYCFNWDNDKKVSALALGYGSLYNHSSENPNADFAYDIEGSRILFTALREIKVGEEILIDYRMEELDFEELSK
jgi:SET domain-containing protein